MIRFRNACVLALVLFFAAHFPALGAPIVLDAIDSGWYNNRGFHDPTNTNYIVGCCIEEANGNISRFRNFFVFDVPVLAAPVTSAELRLFVNQYNSLDPFETYTVWDVVTVPNKSYRGDARHCDLRGPWKPRFRTVEFRGNYC